MTKNPYTMRSHITGFVQQWKFYVEHARLEQVCTLKNKFS